MAILSDEQKTKLRQAMSAKRGEVVTWTKPQINAASQALEDWFEANRSSLSTAIDTATTPLVLSVPQKKRLVAHFIARKAERELS